MPELNYPAWRFWVDIFQMTFMAAVSVYVWWTNRDKARNEQIAAVQSEVAEVRREVELLDAEVKHLPSREDMRRLWERLDMLGGKVEGVATSVQSVRRTVDLINQHLISRGDK